MEIARYSVPEPPIGSVVWCCQGWEDPTNGNMDALTAGWAIDYKKFKESDGIERKVTGYFNPYWVRRIYLGNFFAAPTAESQPEWYRYICREEWYNPADLNRTLNNSFTMPDEEYRNRFNSDYKKFYDAITGKEN